MHEKYISIHAVAHFMNQASHHSINCPFHEIGKSVAYFMKWAKLLPISRNRQFHGLGVTHALLELFHSFCFRRGWSTVRKALRHSTHANADWLGLNTGPQRYMPCGIGLSSTYYSIGLPIDLYWTVSSLYFVRNLINVKTIPPKRERPKQEPPKPRSLKNWRHHAI